MKNAVVVCPDGSNQIMDIDMSGGISVDLFGTKTNFEVKASKLLWNGYRTNEYKQYKSIRNGMDATS